MAVPGYGISATLTTNPEINDLIYELACSRALPRVDCRKSVKHAILSPRWLARVNHALHRTKIWVPLLYAVGLACGSLVIFVPSVTIIPSVNRWLGITTLALGLPSHGSALIALRYDMVVLVCQTFEFWYVTLLNIISTALLCLAMRDARALAIVSASLAFQAAFFIDAIFRAPRVAIVATAFGAITNAFFVVALSFRMLPNVQRFVFVPLLHGDISSDDIVTNALATVAVLLMRNAVRKYQSLQPSASVGPSTQTTVGTCITYRCCLELRPRPSTHRDRDGLPSRATTRVPQTTSLHRDEMGCFTQLRYVGSTKSFAARDVIFPRSLFRLSITPWSRCMHVTMWILGAVSLAALVSFHVLERLVGDTWHGWRMVLSSIALASAGIFCSIYFVHCQRDLLLRELGRSFDFLFVSTQSLFAHICVCDLYAWDLRCLNVAANWCWTQWVLNLDAVTPIMKRKLGFHKVGATLVGFVMLFQQLLLIITIFRYDEFSARLRHHVLFSVRLGQRTLDVSVVSVLLGRLLVTWLWSLRIGWRLFDRQESELLVLQGQLQYDELVGPLKQRTPTPVVAGAATLIAPSVVAPS